MEVGKKKASNERALRFLNIFPKECTKKLMDKKKKLGCRQEDKPVDSVEKKTKIKSARTVVGYDR